MTEATWSLDRLTITGALPPLGHSLTYSPPATPTATTRLPPLPPTPAPTRRPHHGASRECRLQSLTGRLHPWLLRVAFTVGSYWLPSLLALTGRLHRWLLQVAFTVSLIGSFHSCLSQVGFSVSLTGRLHSVCRWLLFQAKAQKVGHDTDNH